MFDNLLNKTIFITGSGKNAGKTTFLNFLLPHLREKTEKLCYLSIGIDGEKEDIIFGSQKPGIYAKAGDFIVTCDSALKNSDASYEIEEVFSYKTELGKPVLLKIIRDGSIELIGPETNNQLNCIVNYLKKEKKIKTILIDGAVNRITQITSVSESEFIYVVKVSAHDIVKSVNQIKTISLIKSIPVFIDKLANNEDIYHIEGAFTLIKAYKIPVEKKIIVINDFTKIFLNWNELQEILKDKQIYYKENFKLNCISVNLYDISRQEFNKILNENNIRERIIYNPYEHI